MSNSTNLFDKSQYEPWDGTLLDSSRLGMGIAPLNTNGMIPNVSVINYVGTTPSNPANTGDYYIDANGWSYIYDGIYWQQQHASPGINHMSSGYHSIVKEEETRDQTDLRLIKRILHLKQCGEISIEKAFNMQLMVISEDEENHVLVKEIIKKLENKLIDHDA